MRNKNRYQRNRSFRQKYWNRVRKKSHPYETVMPWFYYNALAYYTTEEQIENSFDWINKQARMMENGCHKGFFHATSWFRRDINSQNKAQVRNAMQKINAGDYDAEVPTFKRDADWLYF